MAITLLPRGSPGADVGQATLGWTPATQGKVEVQRSLRPTVAAAVLAHVLGHVLGLGHEERGCSVMAGTALERGALQSAALPLSRSGPWCAGLWVQKSSSFLTGPPVYVQIAVP